MSAPSKTPAASTALVRAVRHLLRPLVRVLLANQITFPQLAGWLKEEYVELAENEFALEGRAQTASRLSLLTGIHRKDVQRLRSTGGDETLPAPPAVSLGARLVLQWTASPEFLDPQGKPRPLARQGEFEELVASVSTDIRPRAVLDEWQRLGIARIDDEDRVRLVVDAFVPSRGFEEKVHYFGRNVHDHVAAAAHNLQGSEPPMLERSVYYDGLTGESVDELAGMAEELGMQTLQAVNRRALELQRRDRRRRGRKLRMAFGAYFFRGDADDA